MALAEQLWPRRVKTSSAGIRASEGRKATGEGVTSIGGLNISEEAKGRVAARMLNHDSRPVAKALGEDRYDVVVALKSDIEEVLRKPPHNVPAHKIVVLGVDDPAVDDEDADSGRYARAASEIHAALIAKKEEIFAAAVRPG